MSSRVKKRVRPEDFDLHGDIKKIKQALKDYSRDLQGKTGAVITQSYDDALDITTGARDKFEEIIAEKPIKSVGFALLAGAAIGLLMRK